MSFYFSANGQMKFTTNKVAAKTTAADMAALRSAGNPNSSKFSAEMKNAATSISGKMTTADKNALLANNVEYQRAAKYQSRINEIASRKPRSFIDSDYLSMNLKVLKNYNAAVEKQAKTRKTT